jgi:hypothetical protein
MPALSLSEILKLYEISGLYNNKTRLYYDFFVKTNLVDPQRWTQLSDEELLKGLCVRTGHRPLFRTMFDDVRNPEKLRYKYCISLAEKFIIYYDRYLI